VTVRNRISLLLLLMVVACSAVAAGNRENAKETKESKEDKKTGQIVDSGSFGVFMNGRRIATETFSIQQNGGGSTANSEFKTEGGGDVATQSSELQLTAGGDLRKYEWKEISPGKAQAVVLPNENLLIERAGTNPQDKQEERPFLLPTSTSILDDYFFIHREILAWKYLATGCRQDQGQISCPTRQRAQFGALNPHTRSSMLVSVEFIGKEKVPVHGADRELSRFMLKSDSGEWSLWLDNQFKLVRILVAEDNTEVIRDEK
jgi:hypothetical protein